MPFTSRRAPLILSEEEKEKLTIISKSRTEAKSKVERAKILLGYAKGETVSSIAWRLHTNRPKVERCINKALHFGVLTALHDLPRMGRPRRISQEARAYLLFCHRKTQRFRFCSGVLDLISSHQVPTK